ncbi:MAG: MATE family efflux transporter, partial [Christensenellaceae bacterium]
FYFLMGSSLSNIAADILLVTVIPMGIAGVAVATIFCQGVSCILSVLFLFLRLRAISHEGKIETFSPTIFRKIVKVAVPSILQQGSISVGNIFIQGIVNGFGPSVMAGFTAAIKLNSIATSCFTANANGLSSYTAQNLGRGKSERISPGLKAGYALNALVAVLLCVLFTAGGTACVSLFMTESSETALETGKQFLLIVSPFYLVCSLKITADGVLRGAGAMSLFMIATFTDLIVRVALSYALSVPLGCLGIWLSWPIGWLLGAAVSVFFYAKGTWKRAKL